MNAVSLFLRWIFNSQYNYADGEKMEQTKIKQVVSWQLTTCLTLPYPIIPW